MLLEARQAFWVTRQRRPCRWSYRNSTGFLQTGAVVGVFSGWHSYIYRSISARHSADAGGLGYQVQLTEKPFYVGAAREKRFYDLPQYPPSQSCTMHYQDPNKLFSNGIRIHDVSAVGDGSETLTSTTANVIYYR